MKQTKKIIVIGLLILTGFSGGISGPDDPGAVTGFWQGPHPELSHVKFIFHLFTDEQAGLCGNGYWVENGLYHARFPLDSVSWSAGSLTVQIKTWGCSYRGAVAPDGNVITGQFYCTGESPDSVRLLRVDKQTLHGLLPEHLNAQGEYPYHYQQPQQTDDGLKTASVSDKTGLDTLLSEMVPKIAMGAYGRIHSFLLMKKDRLICEEYFYGFSQADLHPVESVTKSIVSLLIGIAIDRGRINSVDAPVYPFFPEIMSAREKPLPRLTLRHLLNMTSGFIFDERGMLYNNNRLQFLFNSEQPDPPGKQFRYSAGNTEILGGILKKATGKFADEYAEAYLFTPLGIDNYQWDTYKQNGYPLCGGALWLTPRDMLKIGQLVLHKGTWNGRRILSEEWIAQSTAGLVETGIGTDRYGYQWWVTPLTARDKKTRLVWANGLGSQFIFIFPELDLVMVTTGGNWEGGNNGRSWDIFNFLNEYIPKLMREE